MHSCNRQWMAQWNQLRCFLGCQDAGHARHRQHITLWHLSSNDQAENLRAHTDGASSHRLADGHRFLRDIDHARTPLNVYMTELLHRCLGLSCG